MDRLPKIIVDDSMQTGYSYALSEPAGKNFAFDFTPHYSPKTMLEMGVFEGRYLNDCTDEYPPAWFQNAKTARSANPDLNYFGIKSRQPLGVW